MTLEYRHLRPGTRSVRRMVATTSLALLLGSPLLTTGVAQADPSPSPDASASAGATDVPAATASPTDATPGATTSSTASGTASSTASSTTLSPAPSPSSSTSVPGAATSPSNTVPPPSTVATASSAKTSAPTTAPTRTAAPVHRLAASAAPLTLTVSAGGSPVAGRFYEDIGTFVFTGVRGDHAVGRAVEIWRYGPSIKKWYRVSALKSGTNGSYRGQQPVTWTSNDVRFCATLGGSPATASVIKVCAPSLVVRNSTITMAKPVRSIDSLKNPVIAGSVSPARAGVTINIDVKRSDRIYRTASTTTTDRAGRFSTPLTYGSGQLAKFWVRTSFRAANRNRLEKAPSQSITRTAVLNAVVAKTTAADVAKTYHPGCPVGPSKLRTISLNFYGRDKRMHRGVIIIRTDLTGALTRAFGTALAHRFPITKINNPNVYGGNDPKQMEADNTSGFNCRKVTGNPYAQSPHSYGTALDVNTKENPYRDVHGKWWPSDGRSYIDRSPVRSGMLTKSSSLTKSLRKDHFFWGGFWSPGRDYQHFQR